MTTQQKPMHYLGPDLIKLESNDEYVKFGWRLEVLTTDWL